MVVFRCECEQVLGVDEQHLEKVGECPSCGRIVRIPKAAANYGGRLRPKRGVAMAASVPATPITDTAVAVAEPEPELEQVEELAEPPVMAEESVAEAVSEP